jgi:hypothetical protein
MERFKQIMSNISDIVSEQPDLKPSVPTQKGFKVGDMVQNINPECTHYRSEGIVVAINALPNDMGKVVTYQTTNSGKTWNKGQNLTKTEVQLAMMENPAMEPYFEEVEPHFYDEVYEEYANDGCFASKTQKTYKGIKRSDLKNSDFLFPETRSFPIVTPRDVPDAINNFGRMKGQMSYDAFLKKLYTMVKRKGPEFVAALPEATKQKLGVDKSKAEDYEMDFTRIEESEVETPEMELMEYKKDFYEMSVGSLRAIATHATEILNSLENPRVKENLTESWLQGKIAITEDYMRTIHDFIMYVSEAADNVSAADKPGLWENIRKKKEREGKKYRPAQPGDKDRPDSEQWKKITK